MNSVGTRSNQDRRKPVLIFCACPISHGGAGRRTQDAGLAYMGFSYIIIGS